LSRDPIGYQGGQNGTLEPNQYAYVGGLPTSRMDPLGLGILDWLFGKPKPKPKPKKLKCSRQAKPNQGGFDVVPPFNPKTGKRGWTKATIAMCYSACVACNKKAGSPATHCQSCAETCHKAHSKLVKKLKI